MSDCSPKSLALVFSAWGIHALFEYWLGKTEKVKSASVIELTWVVLVAAFGAVAALLARRKEKV